MTSFATLPAILSASSSAPLSGRKRCAGTPGPARGGSRAGRGVRAAWCVLCAALPLAAGPAAGWAGQAPAAAVSGAAVADAFFQAIPDLPLMPGMAEMPEASVVFDQPQGRVVEAASVLPRAGAGAEIRDFYGRTLPALGWLPGGDGAYVREGEILKIEIVPQDGQTVLRVAVMPR